MRIHSSLSLNRGYYEVMPADKMLIDQKTEMYSKVQKQIAAENQA